MLEFHTPGHNPHDSYVPSETESLEYQEGKETEYIDAVLNISTAYKIPDRAKVPLAKFLQKYAEYPTGATAQLRSGIQRLPEQTQVELLSGFSVAEVSEDYALTLVSLTRNVRDIRAVSELMSTFNAILDNAEKVDTFVEESFQAEDVKKGAVSTLAKQNLIHRAARVLGNQGTGISLSYVTSEQSPKELAHINADALLTTQTIRAALESDPDFSLHKIKTLTIESDYGNNIPPENIQALIEINTENWITKEGEEKTSSEYIEELNRKFNELKNNPKAKLAVLKDKEIIVAGVYYIDERGEDGEVKSIYAGGFNVRKSYQKEKVGELFLSQTLTDERKRNIKIRSITSPNQPMLPKYIKMGFREGRHFTLETGEPRVELEIPPDAPRPA